jgi:hypothetical protein
MEPTTRDGTRALSLAILVSCAIGCVVVVAVFWLLWVQGPDVLKHVSDVAAALGPVLTFLTVVAAAAGWIVTARLSGEEARRTEREKRDVANAAHRDLVRARLDRVWGIIDEAVGVKPYQPDVVELFIIETENLYWKTETFQAFSSAEHDLIRKALDRARLDNALTMRAITEDALRQSGKSQTDVIREYFQGSLAALETVFRDVFNDAELADEVARRHQQGAEWVALMYSRQSRAG